jgi:predicted ArsR family transcriptional regulator
VAVGLTDAKRRVLERLKRVDAATVPELATGLQLTEAAVRQHLEGLAAHGLVERRGRAGGGRGRPADEWAITTLAGELFPDRHGDLTVELIDAIRQAVGEDGLDAVIEARTARQLAAYQAVVPGPDAPLRSRLAALARQRTAEGYMAESRRDGDAVVLVEHHCPVCSAAAACTGLCRGELELFRAVLGPDVTVERTQHLMAGDARCAYRVRAVDGG